MQNHTTHQSAPKLCECGCGKPVRKPTHRFLQGHNSKYPDMTPEIQFWSRVTPTASTDCWEWTGALRNGYGVLNVDGKVVYAHRFSYELHYGPLPDGLEACHNCPNGDRRACVNPYHLFAGTHGDNIRDMYSKNRGKGGSKKGRKGFTLNASTVREIRNLAAQGIRYPAIAERFGVSIPAVSLIVTRKRWGHVP